MNTLPRRGLLGAAALALMPTLSQAAAPAPYDYLFLDLDDAKPGTTPTRAYGDHVRSRVPDLTAAGGEVVGYFTPQLGWVGRQVAVLVRWSAEAKTRDRELVALMRDKTVRTGQRAALAPTARPAPTDRPAPGGIYVHRWFVVEAKGVPEFVALSVEGWRDFEVRFDTRILGLFAAERSLSDRQTGVIRLLLITRYGSHGVWEASRDPSTAAMATFAKRQALTRDSWAASTVLVPV